MKNRALTYLIVILALVGLAFVTSSFESIKSKSRDNDYERKVDGMKYHIFVDERGQVIGVRNIDLDAEMVEYYHRQNRK